MTISSLGEYLKEIDDSQVIWERLNPVTAAAAATVRNDHSADIYRLSGKNVALSCEDPLLLIWALLLLDGMAKSVLLLPSTIDEKTRSSFFELASTDVIITDDVASCAEIGKPVLVVALNEQSHITFNVPARFIGQSINQPTRWILATSGTTSTPKLVCHTLNTLTRTVRKDGKRTLRWGLLYDASRFAGLQVFFQSYFSRSTLLLPDTSSSLSDQLLFLGRSGCNALSATPTLWRKILMTAQGPKLPMQQITVGGEIADAQILRALKAVYGKARITHIFASTEAGVGFSVKDGREGFPIEFMNNGPSGIELSISADNHLLLRPKQRGQFYLNQELELQAQDGWIDTGDIIECIDDRCIFKGRANGAINVGGNKVYPEEVERIILELDAIAECLVRGRRSSLMGMLVEAVVVPSGSEENHKLLTEAVKAHCIQMMPRYKVPVMVHVTEQIPLSSSGKNIRRGEENIG